MFAKCCVRSRRHTQDCKNVIALFDMGSLVLSGPGWFRAAIIFNWIHLKQPWQMQDSKRERGKNVSLGGFVSL